MSGSDGSYQNCVDKIHLTWAYFAPLIVIFVAENFEKTKNVTIYAVIIINDQNIVLTDYICSLIQLSLSKNIPLNI